MTLPTKILTRLKNIGNEISTKINNRIAAHNSSEEAHSTLFSGYVKKVDKSNHDHGQITANGKITTTTNNASKVVVTEADGTVKVVEKVPQNNVVHQDISGKLDKLQTGHNGKFLKVNSQGEIEPEAVAVPSINVVQTKPNGVKIGSINGVDFFCNENTTYENATENNPGLMSGEQFRKLKNISEGATSVSFNRVLNKGNHIGTLTINGDDTEIYCSSTDIISDATPQVSGLMSGDDKGKLDEISNRANKTDFIKASISNGTKIGTLKIDDRSIDLECITPTVYTGKDGINITDGSKIGHSNSIAPRTTSSLCKIKYDSQGHIIEGIPVDADALYAAKDHNHDSAYSAQDHAHDRWVQVEMDDQGRGALYVNEKLKMATFHWSSNATTTYIPSGKTSYNTIPSEYRPKYRISTGINIDPSKPIRLYIKGRNESEQPGQVWAYASTSGQQMISCVLTWVYGI